VLDEVGKEMPITIGVSVDAGAIDNVRRHRQRESAGVSGKPRLGGALPVFYRPVCRGKA
jgi:hypothetical protein